MKCSARNVNGKPCAARAVRGGFCPWHDPERAEQMAEARQRGGQHRSNANRAKREVAGGALSLSEWNGLIGQLAIAVVEGRKPPGLAGAVAALCRAAVSLYEAKFTSELEDRLTTLERAAAAHEAARRQGMGDPDEATH